MSVDLSIDIEVVDNDLLQIAAVAFDFDRGVLEPIEHLQKDPLCFSRTIPYALKDINPDHFWAKQEQKPALDSLMKGKHSNLECALYDFATWVPRNLGKKARVWAKPPAFDLSFLRRGFEKYIIECPWHYSQEHDVRTLMWVAQHVYGVDFKVPSIENTGLVKHNALHDAALQATLAQAALRTVTGFRRKFDLKNS